MSMSIIYRNLCYFQLSFVLYSMASTTPSQLCVGRASSFPTAFILMRWTSLQGYSSISLPASQLTLPSCVTTVHVLQHSQLWSQSHPDSLSPAWAKRTSPASPGFPGSLPHPFFHHHALSDIVSWWPVLLSTSSGLPNSFWTCLSFPSALEVLSLSYTPLVPAQVGGPHLRSNCRLEMFEIPELSEALCPPCLPPQSSHSHPLPMRLHLWCHLYATESVSFLSPTFTENIKLFGFHLSYFSTHDFQQKGDPKISCLVIKLLL